MGTCGPLLSSSPAPRRLVENAESFGIEDARGRGLAFVYFEDEAVRVSMLKRLSKADARRLATQIERLPDLLEELKLHRAAKDQPA
jgi:hypothetical protein